MHGEERERLLPTPRGGRKSAFLAISSNPRDMRMGGKKKKKGLKKKCNKYLSIGINNEKGL